MADASFPNKRKKQNCDEEVKSVPATAITTTAGVTAAAGVYTAATTAATTATTSTDTATATTATATTAATTTTGPDTATATTAAAVLSSRRTQQQQQQPPQPEEQQAAPASAPVLAPALVPDIDYDEDADQIASDDEEEHDDGMNIDHDHNLASESEGDSIYADLLELQKQREAVFDSLYANLNNFAEANSSGEIQSLFKNMKPMRTTTPMGLVITFILMYPPTSSFRARPPDSLKNATMKKVVSQGVTENKISIVETFPYAHAVKSGDFKQVLLEKLLRTNEAFGHIIGTYMEDMIRLERAAQLVRNRRKENSQSIIYIGGRIASSAMAKLPNLKFSLTISPWLRRRIEIGRAHV